MKKIALFSRGIADHTADELRTLTDAIDASGMEWVVNDDFAQRIEAALSLRIAPDRRYSSIKERADIQALVCYGGDGTFLKGVKRIYGTSIPILGINSGRLGFLANVRQEDTAAAMLELASDNYTTQQRSLIEVSGIAECPDLKQFAFNEFTIQRSGAGMIGVELFADQEMVGRYWGDGIIVSTPSGSTAYSLSVGGAILAPQCRCLIISPIAPHNLTMRPIVVPDSVRLSFNISTRDDNALATIDNNTYTLTNKATIEVAQAEKSITLICVGNNSFYDTLRNKMMWGIDRRE